MATKIQRRHPQTSPVNHTLLTTMENFMESSKRSNHKLTSLLLRERRQGKIWPPSHLTYTRENITEITSKKFSKAMVEVHRLNLPPAFRSSCEPCGPRLNRVKEVGTTDPQIATYIQKGLHICSSFAVLQQTYTTSWNYISTPIYKNMPQKNQLSSIWIQPCSIKQHLELIEEASSTY